MIFIVTTLILILFIYIRYLLGDPQHRTFFPSPLPCPRLRTSHFTIVTLSLHHPHPSTVSSLSTCHHLVTVSLPRHCHPVIVSVPLLYRHPCFCCSHFLFSVFTYILSVILLHYSLLLWSHFYLLTPIYLHPYLYTLPFLAEIPIFSF